MSKTCNKCQVVKSLSDFQKDPRNKDGLQGICTQCRKEAKQKTREQRTAGLSVSPKISKVCNKCKIEKPSTEFFADAGIGDGKATICKKCKQQSQDAWREKNREKYNASMRAYNKKHYSKIRLKRYNLTEDQYNKMLKDQEGKCKICECHPKGTRPLVVDHHHESGDVRGLLCYGCNRAIAILDNPNLLKKAMAYIAKYK